MSIKVKELGNELTLYVTFCALGRVVNVAFDAARVDSTKGKLTILRRCLICGSKVDPQYVGRDSSLIICVVCDDRDRTRRVWGK